VSHAQVVDTLSVGPGETFATLQAVNDYLVANPSNADEINVAIDAATYRAATPISWTYTHSNKPTQVIRFLPAGWTSYNVGSLDAVAAACPTARPYFSGYHVPPSTDPNYPYNSPGYWFSMATAIQDTGNGVPSLNLEFYCLDINAYITGGIAIDADQPGGSAATGVKVVGCKFDGAGLYVSVRDPLDLQYPVHLLSLSGDPGAAGEPPRAAGP
jgi:hypothetical protein